MNIRDKLEIWLVTNCQPVFDAENIKPSYQAGNISYTIGSGAIGEGRPVDIVFKNDAHGYMQELRFFEGKKVELVSQQTIKNTPFIVHSIIIEGIPFKIIDFYQWLPKLILYRIILFADKPLPIDFAIGSANNTYNENKEKLFVTSNFRIDSGKSGSSIARETDDVAVFRIEIAQHQPAPISVKDIYDILHAQISICQENHLNKTARFRSSSTEAKLTRLWSEQKIIFPDERINTGLHNFNFYLPWLYIFAQLTQSCELRTQLAEIINQTEKLTGRQRFVAQKFNLEYSKSQIEKNPDDLFENIDLNMPDVENNLPSLSFEELVYVSFFTDKVSEDMIVSEIQKWWDLFSQPLLSKKLRSICIKQTELICIVILLAYRYGLKWADILAENWLNVKDGAFLEMIIQITSHISIWPKSQKQIEIRPGSSWSQNSKEILFRDGAGSVKYTRFGEKIISRFSHKNDIRLSCDREVRFEYIHENKRWSIVPNLNCTTVPNLCQIKYYENLITVPLIWIKFEFTVNEIRFRVIFKHKRFQITVSCKNEKMQFEFNGQRYRFDKTQKHTIYYLPETRAPFTQFSINDAQHRSVLVNSPNYKSVGFVQGWAFNRFGVIPEHYIYSITAKKYACKIHSGGNIVGQFFYDARIKEVTISFKHHRVIQSVNLVKDRLCARLLAIDATSTRRNIRLIFNSSQMQEMSEILVWFAANFDFYPEFLRLEKSQVEANQFVQIKLTSSNNEFKVDQKTGVIDVGIAHSWKNVENIFTFIKSCINKT